MKQSILSPRAAIAALALALVASATFAQAQSPDGKARIPYRILYELQRPESFPDPFGAVGVQVRFVSTNAAVKPAAIRAFVETTNGNTAVKIKADGTVVVERRDDYYGQNAAVVTDQPKGTIELRTYIRAEHPGGSKEVPLAKFAVVADAYARAVMTLRRFFQQDADPRLRSLALTPAKPGDKFYLKFPGAGPEGQRELPRTEDGAWELEVSEELVRAGAILVAPDGAWIATADLR